ncbi:hypothetical protein M1L60_02215 [Actinoplanes sp. TRM 88003]|uniref:Uncharacterized protein n=1 Tax=Paractinoplanes aksuensis TaxID=2939490 RepID=A0ABT1DF05_9ACTN|nr:hypothetical protein [Actinoplanes aksuensis]MCO8269401.1 hypothetical protein [Actinoplanes aksuensis]
MGWLRLYVRSRRVPVAVAVALSAAALCWAGWSMFTDTPEINRGLAIFTVLAVLAAMISTLGGDDDSLESGTALLWPPRRALHLLALGVVAAVPLLASRATGASFGPADEMLRAVAGLTGLIGLGVALAGVRMAWQVPLCWAVIQLIVGGGESPPGWRESVFWLVQPGDSRVAAVTAAVLLGAGVLTYAWRVGPRRAPAEAALGQ